MPKIYFDGKNARSFYRSAIIFSAFLLSAACATSQGDSAQWVAHGYLAPGPTSNPETVGSYPTRAECDAAGDAWMSRQVVGNPIFAECILVGVN